MTIPVLALRNLQRKIIRTVILIAIVSMVIGTLFSATLFILSMRNALKIGTYRLGADVLVVPEQFEAQAKAVLLSGEPTSFFMDASVVNRVGMIEGVRRTSPQIFIKPTSFTCCYNVEVFLVAFDPKTDFTVSPWIERHLRGPLTGNEVIVGRDIPVVINDILPFFGTTFKVAGTMEPTGMKFFDTAVFMTLDAAYKMAEGSGTKSPQPIDLPRDRISAVLVQVADDFTPARAAIRIEHDIAGVKAITSGEVISVVRKQLGGLLKGIMAVSAALWVVVLLIMGFAFYMIVNERQREIGLLRAMGANKMQVFGLIMTEAAAVSLTGGMIGLVGGAFLITMLKPLISQTLRVPYLVPPFLELGFIGAAALAFSLATGLLAALIPALGASSMEPYDAIRKGE